MSSSPHTTPHTTPHITWATDAHLCALAEKIRDRDRAEILAFGFDDPLEGLRESFAHSLWVRAMLHKGDVVCVWGLAPLSLLGRVATPWMISSVLLPEVSVAFLRQSRREIGKMLDHWPVLKGLVDARYEASIRWLRWAGFTLDPVVPVNGVPFHPITLKRR